VNKLLHPPLSALRQQAEQADGAARTEELVESLMQLWSLDKQLAAPAEDAVDPAPKSPLGRGALDGKDLENSSS
jgi:hypothetical protein